MSQNYTAQDIEVLSGLDPVRRRPGMYTDTSRPNHLAHEVIDNSVDEALSGHCSRIDVTVYKDGSVEVSDDGRGMPVDVHPKEKVSGVELILTRLHAGGKFTEGTYKFAGGLHGVGVSVVNALSKNLECWVRRGGKEYNISFRNGKVHSKLEVVDEVGKNNTGTRIRFWPDPKYFDSPEISLPKLKHVLKAKAVLCPGLKVRLTVEKGGAKEEWQYTGGLAQYLRESLATGEWLPEEPFVGSIEGEQEGVDWAIVWRVDGGARIEESYVNLIPTLEGGTHVNGFRLGLTEAIREFCEFRSLIPRGIKLAPEDVWNDASYVLSAKMRDPQFAGQTKERLTSRESAAFVSGIAKDQFVLWLNQHPEAGEGIAGLAIANAQERVKASQKVARKRVVSGPALPGKLADCTSQDPSRAELFLVGGSPPAAPQSRRVTVSSRRSCRCGARSSTPGRSSQPSCSRRRKSTTSPSRSGWSPPPRISRGCAITGSASLQTPIRTASTSRRCSARCSCGTSGRWCRPGTCSSQCRRCTASITASRCPTRSTMPSEVVCWTGSGPKTRAQSRW